LEVVDGDLRALSGELSGGCLSDPAARAGDESDFVVEGGTDRGAGTSEVTEKSDATARSAADLTLATRWLRNMLLRGPVPQPTVDALITALQAIIVAIIGLVPALLAHRQWKIERATRRSTDKVEEYRSSTAEDAAESGPPVELSTLQRLNDPSSEKPTPPAATGQPRLRDSDRVRAQTLETLVKLNPNTPREELEGLLACNLPRDKLKQKLRALQRRAHPPLVAHPALSGALAIVLVAGAGVVAFPSVVAVNTQPDAVTEGYKEKLQIEAEVVPNSPVLGGHHSRKPPAVNAQPDRVTEELGLARSKKWWLEAARNKAGESPKAPAGGAPSREEAEFNREAARHSLEDAEAQAAACRKPGGPTGSGRVTVTFAPSGRATSANVSGGGFGGTAVGGCVASVFRRARVPPFSGTPVMVSKSFTILPTGENGGAGT
jgi:hypothetical protein